MGVTTSTANAGATYTPIATQTLTSAQSSVTFSSIAANWTDLKIVAVGLHDGSGSSVNNWRMYYNGDNSSGLYSNTLLYGTGSAAGSGRDSNGNFMYLGLVGQTSNTSQPITIFEIMSYANSSVNKTVLARGNSASDQVNAGAGLWRNTPAITSVTLYMTGQNIKAGSTFVLYGLRAA